MSRRLALAALAFALILAAGAALGVHFGRGREDTPVVSTNVLSDATPIDTSQTEASPTAPIVVPHDAVRLVIPRLAIDASIVVLGVDSDGTMEAPATPTDVAWYDFSAKPGEGGNIVMAGHVDFARYGPAVFWRLRELHAEDVIQVLLDDGSVATYRVSEVTTYIDSAAPVSEIVGPTPGEAVTLITCDGVFNSATHQYDKRLIVRAFRA